MAVYKRHYSTWSGRMVDGLPRFLVMPAYALRGVFESRFLLGFFVLCCVPWLFAMAMMYVYYNPLVRTMIGASGDPPFAIDARFYIVLVRVQCVLSGILCAIIGPSLVAPDLTNNALPLYLSRPITRVWYVAGKYMVLFLMMSTVTWVPDLLLYAVQASLAGGNWWRENLMILRGILLGFVSWITVLSFLALALSAWVKWRLVASGLFVAIPVVASGFGEMINAILRTYWGGLLNLWYLFDVVFYSLFDVPIVRRMSRNMMGAALRDDIPTGIAWLALAGVLGAAMWMLRRRIVAREVVR
jgi:ABC-2 type transport system permease protein